MNLTTNTRAFIEAEQYSDFILLNLHDGLLPESFYRNVTDFDKGDTLHIKTVGSVTLQEAAEDTPLDYRPIETGEITMKITEYVGDAWYVTDDLREDGTSIDMLMAARASEQTRAFQEYKETKFFETAAEPYIGVADPFNINGFPHKIVSSDSNGVFQLGALIRMRLAFDKANVPAEGRILFVDPIAEATLSNMVTITHDVTPFGAEILQNGLARGQRYSMSLHGWDLIVSNRLPREASASDGTNTVANAVYNIAMCVSDDQTKPIMFAWRRQPKVEGERNKDRARDEHVMRARFGFGIQRMDTLGVIAVSETSIDPA
jgi:hypothetical protein